jgi:hypothetical protein
MPRIKSTLFRPILGSAYIAVNTKTSERVVCHVLKPSDSSKYGPIRSGRSCKRGNEFFKVFINDKVYKMNNSLDVGTCLSEDKNWEFTDEKPTCGARAAKIKKEDKPKKTNKPAKAPKPDIVEFVSQAALSKII